MDQSSFYEEGIAALLRSRDSQLPALDNNELGMENGSKQKRQRDENQWSYIPVSKMLKENLEYESSCDGYNSDEDPLNSDLDDSSSVTKINESRIQSDADCFLCYWSSNNSAVYSVNKINILVNMIESNYGKMSNIALAKMAHKYFKDQIWPNVKDKVPMWRTLHALFHIEHHSLEPRIYIGETIKKIGKVQNILLDMIFRKVQNQDGEDIAIPDVKVIKSITELEKTQRELYKTVPNTMNFFNDKCEIDFAKIGSHVNLNKNFSNET